MLEDQFQTRFNAWLKHVWKRTGAFELKVSPVDYLSFSAVKDHQEAALYNAHNGTCVYKLPDDTAGYKPFDAFSLAGVEAWVAVMFRCRDRGRKVFYMIAIDDWIKQRNKSARKSLTEEIARKIGLTCELA